MKHHLEAELIRVESRMTPAKPDEIKTCLAKMILHFPMVNMSQHEKTLLLEDYIAELGRFPADIIASVCRKYCLNIESEFFPKAAKLIAGCVGKFSILSRRRKTIKDAIEESARLKQKRLSDDELKAMMDRVREVEIPQPSQEEKIKATIEMMIKQNATQEEVDSFLVSMGLPKGFKAAA